MPLRVDNAPSVEVLHNTLPRDGLVAAFPVGNRVFANIGAPHVGRDDEEQWIGFSEVHQYDDGVGIVLDFPAPVVQLPGAFLGESAQHPEAVFLTFGVQSVATPFLPRRQVDASLCELLQDDADRSLMLQGVVYASSLRRSERLCQWSDDPGGRHEPLQACDGVDRDIAEILDAAGHRCPRCAKPRSLVRVTPGNLHVGV